MIIASTPSWVSSRLRVASFTVRRDGAREDKLEHAPICEIGGGEEAKDFSPNLYSSRHRQPP